MACAGIPSEAQQLIFQDIRLVPRIVGGKQIFVKGLDGRTIMLYVRSSDTVDSVNSWVEDELVE